VNTIDQDAALVKVITDTANDIAKAKGYLKGVSEGDVQLVVWAWRFVTTVQKARKK